MYRPHAITLLGHRLAQAHPDPVAAGLIENEWCSSCGEIEPRLTSLGRDAAIRHALSHQLRAPVP